MVEHGYLIHWSGVTSRAHKYVKKIWKNGRWRYYYNATVNGNKNSQKIKELRRDAKRLSRNAADAQNYYDKSDSERKKMIDNAPAGSSLANWQKSSIVSDFIKARSMYAQADLLESRNKKYNVVEIGKSFITNYATKAWSTTDSVWNKIKKGLGEIEGTISSKKL